jgi:hypothetical protein
MQEASTTEIEVEFLTETNRGDYKCNEPLLGGWGFLEAVRTDPRWPLQTRLQAVELIRAAMKPHDMVIHGERVTNILWGLMRDTSMPLSIRSAAAFEILGLQAADEDFAMREIRPPAGY